MITQNELKKYLSYDADTGDFRWAMTRGGSRAGDIAGTVNHKGYVMVMLNYKLYAAHRLAFIYMSGYTPEHEVDHVNGVKCDNRWENLRHVTHACNMKNCKVSKLNKSGFTGVQKEGRKWLAGIGYNGKTIYLGLYPTKLEAALARLTFEVNCVGIECNARNNLVESILAEWPQFNKKCLRGLYNGNYR